MGFRAFIAVEVSEEVRRCILQLQDDLRRSGADVKWVEPENLHITVKFLGQVDEEKEDGIREAMEEAVAGVSPFVVSVGGAGSFPGGSRPRVIWVGAHEMGHNLQGIHRRLEQGLSRLGMAPDGRRFLPHITLGRVRSPRGVSRLVKRIRRAAEAECGSFTVCSLTLFESNLTSKGPVYTVRYRAPLSAT